MDDQLRFRYRVPAKDHKLEQSRPKLPQQLPNPPQPTPHHRRPHQQPAHTQPKQHQPDLPEAAIFRPYLKTRKSRKKLAVSFFMLIILIGAGAGGYWYHFIRQKSPIPASVTKTAGFPVLYPGILPTGYSLAPSTFKFSQRAFTYEAHNSDGDKYIFSVQSRPVNFDFSTFYKRGLSNAQPYSVPAGQAAIGTTNNLTIGSLTTDKSWLLVTSPRPQPDGLKLILQNIKSTAHK